MVTQQHNLLQLTALNQVLEQPVEQLYGHHGALVHRYDPSRSELPGSGHVPGLKQFPARKHLKKKIMNRNLDTYYLKHCYGAKSE